MSKKIKTNEKCSECGGAFTETIIGNRVDLLCPCRHSRATQLWIEKQDEAVQAVARGIGNTPEVARGAYIQSVKEGG